MRTMAGRTFVAFWAATAAAVFLLGGGVGSFRAAMAGGGTVDLALAALSGLGLAGAVFVAGRIVLVAARVQRRTRGR